MVYYFSAYLWVSDLSNWLEHTHRGACILYLSPTHILALIHKQSQNKSVSTAFAASSTTDTTHTRILSTSITPFLPLTHSHIYTSTNAHNTNSPNKKTLYIVFFKPSFDTTHSLWGSTSSMTVLSSRPLIIFFQLASAHSPLLSVPAHSSSSFFYLTNNLLTPRPTLTSQNNHHSWSSFISFFKKGVICSDSLIFTDIIRGQITVYVNTRARDIQFFIVKFGVTIVFLSFFDIPLNLYI